MIVIELLSLMKCSNTVLSFKISSFIRFVKLNYGLSFLNPYLMYCFICIINRSHNAIRMTTLAIRMTTL